MSSVEFLPERVSLLYRLSGTDVPIILGAAGIGIRAMGLCQRQADIRMVCLAGLGEHGALPHGAGLP